MKCWTYFNSTLEAFHINQSFSEANLDVFEVAPAMSEGMEDLDGTTFATKLRFCCLDLWPTEQSLPTLAVSFSLVFTHAKSPQMTAMIQGPWNWWFCKIFQFSHSWINFSLSNNVYRIFLKNYAYKGTENQVFCILENIICHSTVFSF